MSTPDIAFDIADDINCAIYHLETALAKLKEAVEKADKCGLSYPISAQIDGYVIPTLKQFTSELEVDSPGNLQYLIGYIYG